MWDVTDEERVLKRYSRSGASLQIPTLYYSVLVIAEAKNLPQFCAAREDVRQREKEQLFGKLRQPFFSFCHPHVWHEGHLRMTSFLQQQRKTLRLVLTLGPATFPASMAPQRSLS